MSLDLHLCIGVCVHVFVRKHTSRSPGPMSLVKSFLQWVWCLKGNPKTQQIIGTLQSRSATHTNLWCFLSRSRCSYFTQDSVKIVKTLWLLLYLWYRVQTFRVAWKCWWIIQTPNIRLLLSQTTRSAQSVLFRQSTINWKKMSHALGFQRSYPRKITISWLFSED